MASNAPNFQLERMVQTLQHGNTIDVQKVYQESFQKLQEWFCDDANGLPAFIKELINATSTPGFTWGRGGPNIPGRYLLNDDVPSNTTGRVVPVELGGIAKIQIAQETAVASKFTVVEHDGSLAGAVDIVTVDMGGSLQKLFDFTGAVKTVNPGRQLAIRVDTIAAKNPDVGITLVGKL